MQHREARSFSIGESMDTEYDVVVVGAGFGGPVAAKICADAGLRVVMLERGERVGEKVISGLTIPFYGFLFGPAFIREGNPPIERPADGIINYLIYDIGAGDIEIDDSLRVPAPLSPVFAFGYNAYCQPFCQWLADRAVEAGTELRTSTVATDVIREGGAVRGVVTDAGERIGAKIVIDAEGCQGLLAIKAGVRKKYPPDTISLADIYDYEMSKEDVDRIFGHTLRFCWGFDEQMIAPPLGYGNGLMVWPYKESLHFMQDQCLKAGSGRVPSLKDFDEYHRNITEGLPWWRDEVMPRARLRARVWDGFEISVGLDDELRGMPNHTDGMLLIGDAAGLESTELCDGVPAAWFSAEIAAEVAISSVRAGDTSAAFLSRYDDRIKSHPMIQWSISRTNRRDLRYAQIGHDRQMLKKLVHDGWGLGSFKQASTPLARMVLESIADDPLVITSWLRMFFRYYHNWSNDRFGEDRQTPGCGRRAAGEKVMAGFLRLLDLLLRRFRKPVGRTAGRLLPLSRVADPAMELLLDVIERPYLFLLKKLEPALSRLGKRFARFIELADPSIFDDRGRRNA
jgi:electron transfer flavoprotein-quinone oxidoreductase